ncbi:MAG: glycosyltransferase, partial [Nannocystaceae bacterium]
ATLARAVRDGDVQIRGWDKNATSYAHTAAAGTLNYMRHTHRNGSKQTFSRLFEVARGGKLPAKLEDLPPVLQRLLPASLETLAERNVPLSGKWLAAEGHTPEVHDELYQVILGSLLRAFRASFKSVRESAEKFDPEPIIDELPTLLRLFLFNIPYYFGFRFFHAERRRARVLHESLGLPGTPEPESKVAIFCDTLDNVDGVGIGLRRLVGELREGGRTAYLCGARLDEGNETSEDDIVRFPSIGTFPIPGYSAYTLGWPSLVEMLRWLDQREIDLVVITTPGPVGLIAMLAAWIHGIPIAGQYHTHVAEFAYRLIGDRSVARIVSGYTGWFYGNLGELSVPSQATKDALLEYGIDTSRVHVIRRGVDTKLFTPRRREENFWARRGLTNRQVALYVGRLSQEKNIDAVVEIFKGLRERGRAEGNLDVGLAIVGDGHRARRSRPSRGAAGAVHRLSPWRGTRGRVRVVVGDDLLVDDRDLQQRRARRRPAGGGPGQARRSSEIVQDGATGLAPPGWRTDRWLQKVSELLADPERLASMSWRRAGLRDPPSTAERACARGDLGCSPAADRPRPRRPDAPRPRFRCAQHFSGRSAARPCCRCAWSTTVAGIPWQRRRGRGVCTPAHAGVRAGRVRVARQRGSVDALSATARSSSVTTTPRWTGPATTRSSRSNTASRQGAVDAHVDRRAHGRAAAARGPTPAHGVGRVRTGSRGRSGACTPVRRSTSCSTTSSPSASTAAAMPPARRWCCTMPAARTRVSARSSMLLPQWRFEPLACKPDEVADRMRKAAAPVALRGQQHRVQRGHGHGPAVHLHRRRLARDAKLGLVELDVALLDATRTFADDDYLVASVGSELAALPGSPPRSPRGFMLQHATPQAARVAGRGDRDPRGSAAGTSTSGSPPRRGCGGGVTPCACWWSRPTSTCPAPTA